MEKVIEKIGAGIGYEVDGDYLNILIREEGDGTPQMFELYDYLVENCLEEEEIDTCFRFADFKVYIDFEIND